MFLLPTFLSRLPLVVSCKATWALHFIFGCGYLVESESMELELESTKTFASHMLLGELSALFNIEIIILVYVLRCLCGI